MSRDNKATLPLSVALGALLVPLAAIASVLIVRPTEAQVAAEEAPNTTVSTSATSTTPAFVDDVARACGPAGRQLVELERAGSATQMQQAALDALRPVCDAVGMGLAEPSPLPTREVSESASQTQVVASVAPAAQADDDEDEDEYESEHEYEYEDGEWEVDD